MDPTSVQRPCNVGDEVFGSDDAKLGTVTAADAQVVTVERGLLHKTHLLVPMRAINSCEGGKVYLTVTKDQAAHQRWDVPPADTAAGGHAPGGHAPGA